MNNLGFVGLGIMGRPMSMNLIKAGYTVMVYNRTRSKIDEMVSHGAIAGSSPKEVAENSKIIISMLPDSKGVEHVILGKNGVIEGVKAGSIVVDMSTASPHTERKIARKLEKLKVEMLDAPVTGGEIGATEGTLTIMIGGKSEVFEQCLPVFRAMGKNIVRVGDIGSGQMAKMCNQILVSVNLLATCEALMLGGKASLDMEKVLGVLGTGAAGSWQLSKSGPKILKGDFEPGFRVEHMVKDLRIALSLSKDLGVSLPGTSVVLQLFHEIESDGMGKKGIQALIHALEKLVETRAVRGSKTKQ